MNADLVIKNLHAEIDGTPILKGVNLEIKAGEVHALMGPNGSGKSTLSSVIMGHPAYDVTEGEILFGGVNVIELDPEERAVLGHVPCLSIPGRDSGRERLQILEDGRRCLEAGWQSQSDGIPEGDAGKYGVSGDGAGVCQSRIK